MPWTYNESQLASNAIYRVRLKLQDTNVDDQQLQDEEIQLLIDQQGSEAGAVKAGARVLAARYARSVDKWVGDLKILASQRARAYRELAEEYAGSAGVSGVPYAGGIRVADKEAHASNSEMVQPHFIRGQHDNLEE